MSQCVTTHKNNQLRLNVTPQPIWQIKPHQANRQLMSDITSCGLNQTTKWCTVYIYSPNQYNFLRNVALGDLTKPQDHSVNSGPNLVLPDPEYHTMKPKDPTRTTKYLAGHQTDPARITNFPSPTDTTDIKAQLCHCKFKHTSTSPAPESASTGPSSKTNWHSANFQLATVRDTKSVDTPKSIVSQL